MIGIIITGHGQFANGIYSSLTMIAGHQDDVEVVTFNDLATEEDLKSDLILAIDKLAHCEAIVIMCDLLGGSPFKIAALLSMTNPKLHIMYGVNLGMLLEFSLTKANVDDIEKALDMLSETGKKNIGKYVFKPIEEENIEEGI